MAKDGRLRIPASQGGLVQYYEDAYKSKLQIKPEVVVGLCIVVGAVVLSLGYFLG